MRQVIISLWLAGFMLVAASSAPAAPYRVDIARQAWLQLRDVEKRHNIPRGLLASMSLVETGQGLEGIVMPWPYSIGVNATGRRNFSDAQQARKQLASWQQLGFRRFDLWIGRHHYKRRTPKQVRTLLKTSTGPAALKAQNFARRFADATSAATFAEKIIASGHDSVDVGLMQINWAYHGQHFASVHEALDPVQNARYAVTYLLQHRKTRDWWRSVGRYHSGTPYHARKYIDLVYQMYRRVHRLDDNA